MTTNNLIDQALSDFQKQNAQFIEIIKVVSAKKAGIDLDTMLSKTRKREIVLTRQIAMTLAKYMTRESLADIGDAIGKKDHATVLHAIKTIHDLIDTDKDTRTRVIQIINILLSYNSTGLVCQICGGAKILQKAWVDPNTMKAMKFIVESPDPTNYFCEDCNCHVKFVSTKIFNTYDAKYQLETIPNRMQASNPERV